MRDHSIGLSGSGNYLYLFIIIAFRVSENEHFVRIVLNSNNKMGIFGTDTQK